MRTVRLKIKETVCEALLEISKEFRTGDRGLTEDVYALIRRKGNGIPSVSRADKIAEFVAKTGKADLLSAKIVVRKRAQFLKGMVRMGYFQALMNTSIDPVDATRKIFYNFQRLYFKYREAQCVTCSLFKQCEFGQQYGNATTNIGTVFDPDFEKKIHPDCPSLPQVSVMNQMLEAARQWKNQVNVMKAEDKLANTGSANAQKDEDEAEETVAELVADDDQQVSEIENGDFTLMPEDGTGSSYMERRSIGYSGSHSGSRYVKAFEQTVERLNRTQLMLFNLGQRFGLALTAHKKGKFKPTEVLSKDRDVQKIKGESDVPKLVPSEHALPDELFEEKLGKRSLQKKQDMKPQKKRRILYLLIDNTGSMQTALFGNTYRVLSRGALASVFSMALTKQVRDEDGILFCRFFADGPGRLISAKDKDDFDMALQLMANADFNGMSTNILAAVSAALKDISQARKSEPIASSEILLITDCQDNFQPDKVKQMLGTQELNVLDVAAIRKEDAQLQGMNALDLFYEGAKALKSVAKNYYKVDPYDMDVNKIVKTIA